MQFGTEICNGIMSRNRWIFHQPRRAGVLKTVWLKIG